MVSINISGLFSSITGAILSSKRTVLYAVVVLFESDASYLIVYKPGLISSGFIPSMYLITFTFTSKSSVAPYPGSLKTKSKLNDWVVITSGFVS